MHVKFTQSQTSFSYINGELSLECPTCGYFGVVYVSLHTNDKAVPVYKCRKCKSCWSPLEEL